MLDAINVSNLGKEFRRYHPNRPRTWQEAALRGFQRMSPIGQFWALRHVNFSVARGRMVGVMGPNGAGKSTLLRLIGGIGKPDEGRIQLNGRVGALLDLNAGFHPDLTGRDNIYIGGVVSGLTRREVADRFDSIVAFAELEESIDMPLHTYSSGMQMRLGFAVAVHIEPEILLIDEVLAVGDLAFQNKCLERIAQFKANGCAIVLVSHQTKLIEELCDEALYLRDGQLVDQGAPDRVVTNYVSYMMAETRRRTPREWPAAQTGNGELRINENRLGSLELEITAVRLLDREGRVVTEIRSGDALRIEIDYRARQLIRSPIFSVGMSRQDGLVSFESSTAAAGIELPPLQGEGRIDLQIERLDLNQGQYCLDVGAYATNWAYAYDYHWHAYPLTIRNSEGLNGVLCPPTRWELRKPQSALGAGRTPLNGVTRSQ